MFYYNQACEEFVFPKYQTEIFYELKLTPSRSIYQIIELEQVGSNLDEIESAKVTSRGERISKKDKNILSEPSNTLVNFGEFNENKAPLFCNAMPVSGTTKPVPKPWYRLLIKEQALQMKNLLIRLQKVCTN